MNKLYMRKIILLSCIAVLLCIYIVQLALSHRTGIKAMPLAGDVDSLTIQTAASEVRLTRKDGSWFVSRGEGQTEYEASQAIVDSLLTDVKDLKLLATASRSAGSDSARYGLDDASKIVVTAYTGQTAVRTLHVGKATSTNSQNYVQLGNDAAVYIIGASLHRDFDKQCDDIRSKSIYSLGDDAKIEQIRCTVYPDTGAEADAEAAASTEAAADTAGGQTERYSFVREEVAGGTADAANAGDAGDAGGDSVSLSKASWKLTSGTLEDGKEVDGDKVSGWISSLSLLSASAWLADNATVPAGYEPASELSFTAGGKDYRMKLYKGKEGEEDAYVMSCSETPYLFKVASYMAARYNKRLSDLSK